MARRTTFLELPLDFRDYKSADWLLKHPECLTISIGFLSKIDLSKPAAGQYPDKHVHMNFKTDPMKHRYVIGIDPGTNTGIAVWNVEEQKFEEIQSYKIHEALSEVQYYFSYTRYPILVRFEDARLRKWYGKNAKEKQQGAGSIKRDCAIWEDFLKDNGIDFQAVEPKAIKTKMTAEAFQNLTGWKGNTNEHGRDAAMIVLGYK